MVPVRTVVISPGEIQGRPVALAALFTLNAAFELTDAGTVFQAKRVRAAITAQSTDVAPQSVEINGEIFTRHLRSVGCERRRPPDHRLARRTRLRFRLPKTP
ncbi:hypothetical protein SH139x_002045 [Planctomycetaceae bacterium SH139]